MSPGQAPRPLIQEYGVHTHLFFSSSSARRGLWSRPSSPAIPFFLRRARSPASARSTSAWLVTSLPSPRWWATHRTTGSDARQGRRSSPAKAPAGSTGSTSTGRTVLREVRRQNRHHRPLRAHRQDLCPLCRGHRRMTYGRFIVLQYGGRHRLGPHLHPGRLLLRQHSHGPAATSPW